MESSRGQQSGSGENKDETFLNLLSSQRRLLCEISSGSQAVTTVPTQRSTAHPPYGTWLSGELVHNRKNQPISNPPSHDLPYSKSSSTVTDRLVDAAPDPSFSFASFETKASELIADCDAKVAAKPVPTLSLGHSLSFLSSEQSRPASRASKRSDSPAEEPSGKEKEKDGNNDDDEDEDDDDLSSIEPLDYKCDLQPTFLINELVSLDQSMARSQESHLAIQNWDKQMGLKRSHSKTMRLSNRSRAKLRSFLKTEITLVSQQQSSEMGIHV